MWELPRLKNRIETAEVYGMTTRWIINLAGDPLTRFDVSRYAATFGRGG